MKRDKKAASQWDVLRGVIIGTCLFMAGLDALGGLYGWCAAWLSLVIVNVLMLGKD